MSMAYRKRMEVSKDLERVVSVFYIGVKGAYQGGYNLI